MSAVAKRYDHEQIELALHVLALSGTKYEYSVDLLKQQGMNVPKQTLWYWAKDKHAGRFEEIKTEVHQQVAERVASQAEQVMLKAGDLEDIVLDQIRVAVLAGDIPAKELPGALRNITTTKALNNDKISAPIRGRPTVIHANRSADEILRALKQLEPGLIIDSTAELIEPPQDPTNPQQVGSA